MYEAHDPASPVRWWQTRWFVLACVGLAMLPLLWPDVPPLVDLPGHMGRYRVQLNDAAQTPWIADWYGFHWSLIGNLGVDLLIVPLAKLLGIEGGVKLIVIAIPALTVAGLLWIAREVHGRIPPTALFALPLAYSFPFHFGFVNFALAMALALNAFALWLRLARLGHVRLRAALFAPIAILIWVCHTFGWGVLGVLAFSAELIRQHDKGRRWFNAWLRAAWHCLPMAIPMLLMVAWRTGGHVSGQTTDWFNWGAKYLWATMVLRDRWELWDIASVVAMCAVLVVGLRNPAYQYSRNLALSALFLLAVYCLLPRIVFGSAYADMRLAPFVFAIALIALRPRPGAAQTSAQLIAIAGLAFFGARIASNTVSFWMYDRAYDRELAALDHLPVGARLISFTSGACRINWTMHRFEHLPAMALVRRSAFSNDQWSMAGAQLLTVRFRDSGTFSHDASQITTVRQCPFEGWRPIGVALRDFPRADFDYVWLIQPPAYDPALVRDLTPVWRSGTSALYRVNR